MLRFSTILILLGLCAVTQTQALQIVARAALPPSSEESYDEEDPEPQGRIFSIIREQEPAKYPLYDTKPIIITSPPQSLPQYPYPPYYPPSPPQPPSLPYPQPYPVPVPVHPPYPPYIKPHHHHHHHGHHGHNHGPAYGFGGYPPFINFTYAPVTAAATTTASATTTTGDKTGTRIQDQMPFNDISLLSQLLLAQAQPQVNAQQLPQLQQIQQLPQFQQLNQLGLLQQIPQLQQFQLQAQQPLSNNVIYQQSNAGYTEEPQGQQIVSNFLPSGQLIDYDLDDDQNQGRPTNQGAQLVVRRQKPKKRSKKNKKAKVQTLYLALNPTEEQAQIQSDAAAQEEETI